MALHTLQPDLHRVATALRRIADLTENVELSEATAGAADVVVAIKDALEAERRLEDRLCSLNNLSADLTPPVTF